MAKTEVITCDGCGADITTTSNSVDWRLVLAAEPKTPWFVAEGHESGAMTDMYIPRPIDHTMYFCDVACLRRGFDAGGSKSSSGEGRKS